MLSNTVSPQNRDRPYYGYTIVLCSLILTTLTFGSNYSFGIFFDPILTEFGWARAETSIAFSITTGLSGLLGIVAGKITDSCGPRVVSLVAGVCLALGCFLMSTLTTLWQLYLFFGVLVGIGVGGGLSSLVATVSRWFVRRRGAMTSIVFAGIGVGTIIIPLIANRLLANYNWRFSFQLIGLGILVLAIPAALFLKRDPSVIGELPYGAAGPDENRKEAEGAGIPFHRALLTFRFWVVCTIYFTIGYGTQGLMVHIVPYAIHSGISPANAATILSTIGMGSILGRLGMGAVSDRIGIKASTFFSLGTWLLAMLWLQFAGSFGGLHLFGLLFGISYGALIGLTVLIGAHMFGLVSLGTITGTILALYTGGGAIGPALTGYLFDLSGGYTRAFYVFLAVAAAGLIFSLLLKPGDWERVGSSRVA